MGAESIMKRNPSAFLKDEYDDYFELLKEKGNKTDQ